MTAIMPHARQDGLVIQDLPPNETLVYDLGRHHAHCLNRTATLVWRHCDGQMTVAEAAEALQAALSPEVDERLVYLTLEQLRTAQLLQEEVNVPLMGVKVSRRAFVRKLGVAGGLLLLPVVTSVKAPLAVEAASLIGGGPPPPGAPVAPTATSQPAALPPLASPTPTDPPPLPAVNTATPTTAPPLVTATSPPAPPTSVPATSTPAPTNTPAPTATPDCIPTGQPCQPTGKRCCSGGCNFDRVRGVYVCS